MERLLKLLSKMDTTTMEIEGGINLYSLDGIFRGSGIKNQNRKVKYLNKNGYDNERDFANRYLIEGEIYDLEEVYVGRSSTSIKLLGIDEQFNSVLFKDSFEHLKVKNIEIVENIMYIYFENTKFIKKINL